MIVSEKKINENLKICDSCENKIFRNKYMPDVCKLCDCFIYTKIRFSKSKCPINKWNNNE